jgi:hypothetical protein
VDDGIWIYGLAGSFTIIAGKIASASRKFSSSTSTRLHLPIYVSKAAAPAVCIASSQIASDNQISKGPSTTSPFMLLDFFTNKIDRHSFGGVRALLWQFVPHGFIELPRSPSRSVC